MSSNRGAKLIKEEKPQAELEPWRCISKYRFSLKPAELSGIDLVLALVSPTALVISDNWVCKESIYDFQLQA